MPKRVDHARRRDEIALVACRAVARHGFARATVEQIARAAGYTTGMVAYYFDSKQEIILAALRLILRRMDQRLQRPPAGPPRDGLLEVLTEALPIDAQRRIECAFWTAFWGQLSADPRLKRLNAWVHREYRKLFERCLAEQWPESRAWSAGVRGQALRSLITFLNGITTSAVSSPRDWPARVQVRQLELHLALLRNWARGASAQGITE
ncbi:MAG: TetR family transcriptional regulator C-terminal domain-containing protein [Gammaproteobacteria bacterium]|nr:TetR family transcriptional regulator C-terminal domain-containing protein [Gammaproteobacteria bacterium]MDE2250849.1 TetR family transcriptional regulator C-terminal domain-containing protein [Gammaproteobacteria bacterium]